MWDGLQPVMRIHFLPRRQFTLLRGGRRFAAQSTPCDDRPVSDEPVPMHEHALDSIRVIRETMERAGSFTSIPGWGGFVIGLTACGAAAIAQREVDTPRPWLMTWLTEAGVAAVIAAATMALKARRAETVFMSGAARRFFVSYFAPLLAGGVLTFVLAHRGAFDALPSVWLLLYGAAFVSSGAFSIRVIPLMGVCFMLLGALAALVRLPVGNLILGAGFGGLHIVFGLIIARRYGG